ncbi:hypothetical protein A9Q99_02500 [Gammaproteobacteria bacterium 45_16_T64]|nr:hypothetical protein A9Q99_02500 [Gammaproteobacteria bacterium 45_16_T64]
MSTLKKYLPMVFLVITLLFQLTALKFIWHIELISSILNLLMLLALNMVFLIGLFRSRFRLTVWCFYIIPGLLVFLGMSANILYNINKDLVNLSYIGLLIPWGAYLAAPVFLKQSRYFDRPLWYVFYCFMLLGVTLALCEYFNVFVLGGLLKLRELDTSGGVFLAGFFSLFYPLESGGVHFRMYGWFLEPGTLAMYLIPATAYAYYQKAYLSVVVMLIGVFFAFSIGAFISLLLMPLFFYMFNKKRFFSFASIVMILMLMGGISQLGFLKGKYDAKQASRMTRLDNIEQGISELPGLILSHPFGFSFQGESGTGNSDYSAKAFATFMPMYKFVLGGFFALIGYLIVLLLAVIVSCIASTRNNLTLEEKAVFSTLIPLSLFVVQRTTIWESALFAFLFAPSIIRQLDKKEITK